MHIRVIIGIVCSKTNRAWARSSGGLYVLPRRFGSRWVHGVPTSATCNKRAGPAAVGGASEVALKMIRNNDIMKKAAQKEVALLKELAEHDPANRKHCIR